MDLEGNSCNLKPHVKADDEDNVELSMGLFNYSGCLWMWIFIIEINVVTVNKFSCQFEIYLFDNVLTFSY